MLGVLAASSSRTAILTAGIAGLAAGALSMAVGEYVSVSSQRDSEREDVAIEKRSLENNPKGELAELTAIYERRGLDKKLARQVAEQMHRHDALDAHARDELNLDKEALVNPLQAALASAIAFSAGALVPILAAYFTKGHADSLILVVASLAALAITGVTGAYIGGGRRIVAASRVFFGGGAAMAITAFIGHLIAGAI
jgi:VIT1/CCC1 family predicted Fe2+/Mn2+ transporter